MTKFLLCNRICTPDGTVLESNGRYDFEMHKDAVSGEVYFTDGGIVCVRRSINKVPYRECDVYTDDPFDTVRSSFKWGTYGKCGKLEKKYVALKDLSCSHIQAILDTQHHIPDYIRQQFLLEQSYRHFFPECRINE